MDVETDVGHIVKVFARDQPDDLADRAFGIMAGHARKSFRIDLFISVRAACLYVFSHRSGRTLHVYFESAAFARPEVVRYDRGSIPSRALYTSFKGEAF